MHALEADGSLTHSTSAGKLLGLHSASQKTVFTSKDGGGSSSAYVSVVAACGALVALVAVGALVRGRWNAAADAATTAACSNSVPLNAATVGQRAPSASNL